MREIPVLKKEVNICPTYKNHSGNRPAGKKELCRILNINVPSLSPVST